MRSILTFSVFLLAFCVVYPQNALVAAEPARSTLADGSYVPLPPLEDLTAQFNEYRASITREMGSVAGSARFTEDAAILVRDASGLALVALAIGLADDDSEFKKSAPHIVAAAKQLAAAQNITEATAAYEALTAALTNTSDAPALTWSSKIVDLTQASAAKQSLFTAIERLTSAENRFNSVMAGANAAMQRARQQTFANLAGLAVIIQGTIPNVEQTKVPDNAEAWKRYSEEFRNYAIAVNAAAHDRAAGGATNFAAFREVFQAMETSCDACHAVFYPDAIVE